MKNCLFATGLVLVSCAVATAGEMRLMSYNIGHGEGFAGGPTNLAVAADEIRRADPDFVGLQDVDWMTVRAGRLDQAKGIGRRTGFHATFAKACFLHGTPDEQHGVALLSHEKPLAKHLVRLPGGLGHVLLICEFTDCFVGVTEFDADPSARGTSRELVDRKVAELAAIKPVYLTDEDGGVATGTHRERTVAVGDPVLGEPAVVPRPVSLRRGSGTFALKASDVTPAAFVHREDPGLPKEGYGIEVGTDGIVVTSSDDAGTFYALQTLRQLAVPRWGRLHFPVCAVSDRPRFGWRGFMVDDVRHFFGKAAMRRTLDMMAYHKLNVLHWHLSDDEGWRLPVPEYPQLAEKGAVREHSKDLTVLGDRFEGGTYGPYSYTEDDIREIVAYARARHIRIVPEVDFPGHCRAALRAFPDLLCFPLGCANRPADAVDDAFCLGDDRSLAVMTAAFDSLCRLFPDSEYIHIGGDEVCTASWKQCPKCQARMREIGARTPSDLQAWLTGRLIGHLAAKGRRIIGWDEIILNGTVPAGAAVMSWRGAEGGIAASKAGLSCVMCPHVDCYFNYDQCVQDDPVVYPWWSHPLPLARAYAYDPLAGMEESAKSCVLGGQCCLWANLICDEMQLQWQAWPRACATAEVFWSPAELRDFGDFSRRMAVHRKRLIGFHVNCAPLK